MKSTKANALANHNLWDRLCECYSLAEADDFRRMVEAVSARAEMRTELVRAFLKGKRVMREIEILQGLKGFLAGATIENLLDDKCDLKPFKAAADEAREGADVPSKGFVILTFNHTHNGSSCD